MAESEHSVKIKIEGNSTSAEGAFSRVRAAVTRTVNVLSSVKTAVSKLMGAFSTFGMAVQGVISLVNAVKWLYDKLTETARFVAKLKWDIEMRTADAAELGAAETDRERAAVYARRERRETAAFDAAKAKVEAETAKSVGERDETMIARWREDMARAPD